MFASGLERGKKPYPYVFEKTYLSDYGEKKQKNAFFINLLYAADSKIISEDKNGASKTNRCVLL